MEIFFIKISDEFHEIRVHRSDHSIERKNLNSRIFLRHDLAHFAVELSIPISGGYCGSVAAGASLDGNDFKGQDIVIAEMLSGPVQTLMRLGSPVEQYQSILERVQPHLATTDKAKQIHELARQLQGHWQATPFGDEMFLSWPVYIGHPLTIL